MICAINYNAIVINHDAFIRRYVGYLWKTQPKLRTTFGDVEDALQHARLEVVRAAQNYDYGGTANFETVARKYIRRGLQRACRKQRSEHTTLCWDVSDETPQDAEDDLAWAIEQLSQYDQELLAKRFGLRGGTETPATNLAELLGVSSRTVQRDVREALDRLREIMSA